MKLSASVAASSRPLASFCAIKLSRLLLSAIVTNFHMSHITASDWRIWTGGIVADGEYEAAARGPTRRRAEANS